MKDFIQLDLDGYYVGIVQGPKDPGGNYGEEGPPEVDTYLQPANSIEAEAPTVPSGKRAKWSGSDWIFEDIPQVEQDPPSLDVIDIVPTTSALDGPDAVELLPYMKSRLIEYGSLEKQVEFITENGLEAWQTKVAVIKEKYPKP